MLRNRESLGTIIRLYGNLRVIPLTAAIGIIGMPREAKLSATVHAISPTGMLPL
jgi:hypothetical protein